MTLWNNIKFDSIFFCHYIYYPNLKLRRFETTLILYFLNRTTMASHSIQRVMNLSDELEHEKMHEIL